MLDISKSNANIIQITYLAGGRSGEKRAQDTDGLESLDYSV